MNTASKLLAAMRHNPRDWSMAQLLTVARQVGLEVRSNGGSHHVFSHPAVHDPICVPAHRPIKPRYVSAFIALVDAVKESS